MKSPRTFSDNSPIDRKGGNDTPRSHLAGVMAKHMKPSSRTEEIEIVNKFAYLQDYMVNYAGCSINGYNPLTPGKLNQDRLVMYDDHATDSLVIACLDGHGANGHKISQCFAEAILLDLPKHPQFATDIQEAISCVLKETELQLYRENNHIADFSGSTLALAVVRGKRVTVANVGDSRVVFGKRSWEEIKSDASSHTSPNKRLRYDVQEITLDHKPDQPDEYARILASGGRVFAVKYSDGIIGPPRVWLGQFNLPGLAMSRSLGDFVVHTAGVISTPDFYSFDLPDNDGVVDCMLILATDGLWDVVSCEEAVTLSMSVPHPSVALSRMMQESRTRWLNKEKMMDDTTVCIAHIQKVSQTSPNHSPATSVADDLED